MSYPLVESTMAEVHDGSKIRIISPCNTERSSDQSEDNVVAALKSLTLKLEQLELEVEKGDRIGSEVAETVNYDTNGNVLFEVEQSNPDKLLCQEFGSCVSSTSVKLVPPKERRPSKFKKATRTSMVCSNGASRRMSSTKKLKTGDSIAVGHKAASLMGDKELEKKAMEYIAEDVKINRKVLNIVGDASKLAPAAARKRLGSEMGFERKVEQVHMEMEEKRKKDEESERIRQLQLNRIITMNSPQADAGIANLGNIDRKAAALMGDAALQHRALESVGANAQVNSKVMQVVGDANKLAPRAARKRLGSVMSPSSKAEQLQSEVEERSMKIKQEKKEMDESTQEVLDMNVKPAMRKVKKSVTLKAANVLGDATLKKKALEAVPEDTQVNKKVLDMLGSAAVVSSKARDMMGEDNEFVNEEPRNNFTFRKSK